MRGVIPVISRPLILAGFVPLLKRLFPWALIPVFVVLGVLTPLYAADVTGALFTLTAQWTNTGASDKDDFRASLPLSGAALIDQNLMGSDALNSIFQKGGVDQPGMPPTKRITIEGAVLQDGDSFTDFTAAAQSTTPNDVQLLPPIPAVNDAFYFGCDNPCRILTTDIGTAGANVLTLTLEYWDGNSYESLAGVTDDTSTFTKAGRNTISWDMPLDWDTQTVTGSAVNSFWGRARVSAFTSQATQPLGDQLFWENGEWWGWVENIPVDNQEQYTLFLGGANIVTSHQLMTGAAGLLTADDPSIEVSGSYVFGIESRLNFIAPSITDCIICKTGSFTVNVSGTASAPAIGASITDGSGTTEFNMTGITLPDTARQIVVLASDGTDLVLLANAGGGLRADAAKGGTNNGNTWTWASQGGTDYIESIRVRAAAPTVMNVDRSFTSWDTGAHTTTQAYTGALGLDNQ